MLPQPGLVAAGDHDPALHMPVPIEEREGVAGGDVALCGRGVGQQRAGRREGLRGVGAWGAGAQHGALLVGAEILRELGIGEREAAGERQVGHGLADGLQFDSLNVRVRRVLDDGEAVLPKIRKLELAPILVIQRAVEGEPVIQPACLEAEFVVHELVGLVIALIRAAIEAARPIAGGIGEIHQLVGIELVGEVDLVRLAGTKYVPVQVHTRCIAVAFSGHAVVRMPRQVLAFAGVRSVENIEIPAESKKAVQRIGVVIVAHAAGDGELRRDVEGHFAEGGEIAIRAQLIGEPQRVRPAGNGIGRRKAVDHVILQNVVRLLFLEQADQEAEPVGGGRRKAQLVAVFREMVLTQNILQRRRQRVTVGAHVVFAVGRIVGHRVIGVVAVRVVVAHEQAAGVSERIVAKLALHGEAG